MFYLLKDLYFPPVAAADSDGILGIGGDLSEDRLKLAYRSGIFPWFQDDDPIIWWAPGRRMVLFPEEFKVSKSMRNILNRNVFRTTFNQNFRDVISGCQNIKRNGQDGTWITNDMIEAYCRLNATGFAKSIEVWQDGELAGGLYGIDLGHVFCGESMFSKVPNASKMAFIALVGYLKERQYRLLDCQVYNEHLESLGCREIGREAFMKILRPDH